MAIDLKKEIQLLQALQDVDSALQRIHEALATIPERRVAAETTFVAAMRALDAKQAERDTAEKTKRSDELELSADVERVRQRETKLYAIKTNKEYQAALKEIAEGKKVNREREDRILTQMEVIETTTKEITQLSQECVDKETGCREIVRAIEVEAVTLEQERVEKAAVRNRVFQSLSPDVVRLYEYVRRRHWDAVAEVRQGICQGCHMRIPPQMFLELQRWMILAQCPSCNRILYSPDETSVVAAQP